MSRFGFFDADRRLSVLSLKGDQLVEILALVPWEKFRADIEMVVLTAAGSKKSPAGRKPIDARIEILLQLQVTIVSDRQRAIVVAQHVHARFARVGDYFVDEPFKIVTA